MANNEILKSDDKFVHTHVDEALNGSDAEPLQEKLAVESIVRTTHRLHIKTIMAAAKLVEKSRI